MKTPFNLTNKKLSWWPIFYCFLVAISVYGGIFLNGKFNNSEAQWKMEREMFDLQIKSLSLMVGENGKILILEKALIEVSKQNRKSGIGDLGLDVPQVAHKILELGERFRDDGLEISLILGIIEVESRFDPRATSTYIDKDGSKKPLAYGLMQVVRSTSTSYLKDLGYTWSPEVMYNPEIALEVGVRHLVDLHRQYVSEGLEFKNEWTWSVQSYLWGERPIKESMRVDAYSKNSPSLNYWARVREAQNKWKANGF